MVITKTIPAALWRKVLDDLSRVHGGATVRLVVLDDAGGILTHGDGFTLDGLTADGRAGSEAISAILSGSAHITHIIDRPQSVHLEALWESRTANVQITDESGTRTLICLGPPVLPDVMQIPSAVHSATAWVAKRDALQRLAPTARIPLGA